MGGGEREGERERSEQRQVPNTSVWFVLGVQCLYLCMYVCMYVCMHACIERARKRKSERQESVPRIVFCYSAGFLLSV